MVMNASVQVWVLIALAVLAANLPFLTRRVLGVWSARADKPLSWRLLELLVLYIVVGGIGMAMENSLSQNAPQGWEFYAVTLTLFVTLAFPGFVYRYLAHRH
ncbi:MAG: hypothetical protein RIS04_1573 [Pseudomonadota bacterium]|jgi:hypothetical protein